MWESSVKEISPSTITAASQRSLEHYPKLSAHPQLSQHAEQSLPTPGLMLSRPIHHDVQIQTVCRGIHQFPPSCKHRVLCANVQKRSSQPQIIPKYVIMVLISHKKPDSDNSRAIFSSSRSRGSTFRLRSYMLTSCTSPAFLMLLNIQSCSSGTGASPYGTFWYD